MSLKQVDFSELIRIIRANGNKRALSLFKEREKDTKIRKLARKFAFEKEYNEHEWAIEICGESENSNSYVTHRSLLRKELLDQIFNLEIRTGPQRRKSTYRLRKSIFLVRTLLLLGARRTAMSIVPVAMKIAKEYELTSDRIELLDALCSNASINGWRMKFEKCDSELREAMRLRVAEVEIASFVRQIDVENVGKVNPGVRALRLAETIPHEALVLFREFPTFNVGLAYYRIAVTSAQMTDHFQHGLTMCEGALTFLSRFPKLLTSAIQGEFELKRLEMALASGSFEAAAEFAARCQKLFLDGTNSWFVAKECEFLLLMHTKQWHSAVALQDRVVTQSRFPAQPDQVKQKWELFGHYADLTSQIGKAQSHVPKRSSFGKILHEVPIYHQDKGGYNTSLFILQYLILASNRDLSMLTDRSEAMAKFVFRNFRGQHDRQAYAFLKTLMILTNSDFDVEKTKSRAVRYIDIFSETGREKVDETQTVPFEVMWDWIVNWVGTGRDVR